MKTISLLLGAALVCSAQQFSATRETVQGMEMIHLKDSSRGLEVVVAPSFGDRAIQFLAHGKNILYFPYKAGEDFVSHPDLNGVPFLAPWANRLDGPTYWANGAEYQLNPGLKNYQGYRSGLPIHGLVAFSKLWEVKDVTADSNSALVTCVLPFWKYPELMEQWPFAQEYEITYRLSSGTLEVRTSVINRSAAPIPIVLGFHPYYRLPDHPRDTWSLQYAFQKTIETDKRLIPTGEFKQVDLPNPLPLKQRYLDNGYTDLKRDAEGRAHFVLSSGEVSIEVMFGPKFPVSVIWEPPAKAGPETEFLCIEPMAGPTNALNLAHAGKYDALQSVAPGSTWTESFWIKPSGF